MDIDERIMKTVAYFDLFDYPLTRAETHRWLYGKGDMNHILSEENGHVPFCEVDDAISGFVARGILKEEGGYVCAADREGLPAIREERFRHSLRKKKRARRWARIFGALPGVELVGIGNTLSYDNAKDGSDIDFFIVTAPGTIWRTRFFSAGLAALCGLRPKAGDSRDRLCLSFFMADEDLDISSVIARSVATKQSPGDRVAFARDDERPEDIYLHYWTRHMVPLCAVAGACEKFRRENSAAERGITVKPGWLSRIFGILGHLPGDFLKNLQISHFPGAIKAAAARRDGSVVISDSILKFHVNDRRAEVYDKWVKRFESLMSECLAASR